MILQECLYYFRIKTYVKTLPTVNKASLLHEILKFWDRSIWCHLQLFCESKINSKLYWLCHLDLIIMSDNRSSFSTPSNIFAHTSNILVELIKILRMSDNTSSFSTASNIFPQTNNIFVDIWHLYFYYEENELTLTDRVSNTLSYMSPGDFLWTNRRYAYFKEPRYSYFFHLVAWIAWTTFQSNIIISERYQIHEYTIEKNTNWCLCKIKKKVIPCLKFCEN